MLPRGASRAASAQAGHHHRADRLPRPARPDDDADGRQNVAGRRRGPLATMFDEEPRRLPGPGLLLAGATTSALRRRTRGCCRTCPPSTWRTPGGWTPRRTATTSSTTASTRCCKQQARANFPFLGDQHRRDGDRQTPRLGHAVQGFTVNGVKVGVIGAELENTPELVPPAATAGLTSWPKRHGSGGIGAAAPARRGRADRGHPRGHERGNNAVDGTPRPSLGRPDHASPTRSRTPRSTRSWPATPTGSRTRWSATSRHRGRQRRRPATRWCS